MCLPTLHRDKQQTQVKKSAFDVKNLDSVSLGAIIGAVVAIIIVNLVVVYVCRRKAKREMQNDMVMQIESAVNQYYALSSTDNNNTAN